MREMVSTQTFEKYKLHQLSKTIYMETSIVYIVQNWLLIVSVTLNPTRDQVER